MSNKNKEELINKYLEAESNLNEEQDIFNTETANSDFDPWFKFVKKSRIEAPENLNNSVWDAIQSKRKRTQQVIYGIVTVAASVALIVSLSVNSPKQSDQEKEALLKEALSMFHDEVPKAEVQNIIYEDDLIVIYTSQNK